MSPTLPALARDDEKVEEEKETFGNTSGPQAAHSWTSVMLREKNSAQELHLVWHLHLPQLRFKSQAQFISAESFHILQSKWFHWFTIVCIHSRREAHVSCFASKKTPVPPLPSNCGPSPPAVGATLVLCDETPRGAWSLAAAEQGWSVPARLNTLNSIASRAFLKYRHLYIYKYRHKYRQK